MLRAVVVGRPWLRRGRVKEDRIRHDCMKYKFVQGVWMKSEEVV
jgi:hypothetical protein